MKNDQIFVKLVQAQMVSLPNGSYLQKHPVVFVLDPSDLSLIYTLLLS